MHQNSLEAYVRKIENGTISGCRRRVYELIRSERAITAKEIADRLGWGINCVTPRICELKRMGAVVEGGTIKNGYGITVTLYSPVTVRVLI